MPEQAAYNVLEQFFRGTPSAMPFGGPTLEGTGGAPTAAYLNVSYQDVIYAQRSTALRAVGHRLLLPCRRGVLDNGAKAARHCEWRTFRAVVSISASLSNRANVHQDQPAARI